MQQQQNNHGLSNNLPIPCETPNNQSNTMSHEHPIERSILGGRNRTRSCLQQQNLSRQRQDRSVMFSTVNNGNSGSTQVTDSSSNVNTSTSITSRTSRSHYGRSHRTDNFPYSTQYSQGI